MTLEEIEKKAEEYARKTMKVDWEGFPIDKEARKEAYIAGATEICSCCSMGFKDMMKEKPTEAGRYLVIRKRKNPQDLPNKDAWYWVCYASGIEGKKKITSTSHTSAFFDTDKKVW